MSLLPVVPRLSVAMPRISFLALALAVTNAAFAQQAIATPPASITLEQAIALARANEPNFAAAAANKRVTALDHSIATAALLPNVSYHNQVLYTQPNGLTNGGGPTGNQAAPGGCHPRRPGSPPPQVAAAPAVSTRRQPCPDGCPSAHG